MNTTREKKLCLCAFKIVFKMKKLPTRTVFQYVQHTNTTKCILKMFLALAGCNIGPYDHSK